MINSIVLKSNLSSELRLDSEYYKPDILISEKRIKSKPYKNLGDICELISGPFGSTVTKDKYDSESNCRYIRGKDIHPFFVDDEDSIFIDSTLYNDLPQFHLREGDILITVVGMNFGKVALVKRKDCPAIFSCKSSLLRNSEINSYYVVTFLSSKIGYKLIRRGKRGAAQPGINLFDIWNIPIPILSEHIQKTIEKNIRRAIKLLEESKRNYSLAKSMLLSEIGLSNWKDKHVLTFVKNYSETFSAGRIDAEYFQPKYYKVLQKIIDYKNGWDRLENVTKAKKGIEVGSNQYLEDGIPFVRVSNLSPFELSEEKFISEDLYNEYKKYQPKKGEILFSKDGTPGIAYLIDEEPKRMIPSSGILRLIIKTDKIDDEVFVLILNSLIVNEQMNRDVGGSIIIHWRLDQIKDTIIPIIRKEVQEEIKNKIIKSKAYRLESKKLIEYSKRAVEIAIEKSEDDAYKYFKEKGVK